MKKIILFCFVLTVLPMLSLGQYAPPAGQDGSTAIHCDSSVFVGWATSCVIERGLQQLGNPSLGYASYGEDAAGCGKADNNVVSLGDGGMAVFSFDSPVCNAPGPDFAVFENSFDDDFLELAFVEVSSDGINYFRFPAVSLTQTDTQIDGYGNIDAALIHNFAGKYRALYGTPFDLDDVKDSPLLDKNNVRYVRIIDVVGSIDPQYATYDSNGNIVNDPWPTPFFSSGFDADAVGVIHDVLHNALTDINVADRMVYPNPFHDFIVFDISGNADCAVYDIMGQIVIQKSLSSGVTRVATADLHPGCYVIRLIIDGHIVNKKMIKK